MINNLDEINAIKFKPLHAKKKKFNIIFIYVCFILLYIIIFIYFILINKKLDKIQVSNLANNDNIKSLKDNMSIVIKNLESKSKNKDNLEINHNDNEIFNENINMKIKENQHHFCRTSTLFYDPEIENLIKMKYINFQNISFNMFIYKKNDAVSLSIKNTGAHEIDSTNNILKCLNFFELKKKLPKKEITIIDLGANIGWYSFLLGKAGYEIFSFEVSKINNYILKKNFCKNKDINITIINKGIGLEEEKCLLHHPKGNIGNGVILCGEKTNIPYTSKGFTEDITFTRLSNYISFLSQKNLALIKIDIEGSEGKAFESGKELITKYHIPFIFTEFCVDYLKMQGTDPRIFLENFEKNGYKFSIVDFLSNKFLSIDSVLKLSTTNLYINLYMIYYEFLIKN